MDIKYILVIDQGTTSSKATLFDDKCNVIDISQKELPRYFPQEDFVEQKPEEIIDVTFSTIKQILENNQNINIESLGIVNQRETIILWDKVTGKTIYNAIVWQDRRTEKWCNENKAEFDKKFNKKTGLILDSYFSASKIKWILENVKEAQDLLKEDRLICGTVDCFLLWHLTNKKVHATDITNASRTLLCNIIDACWDDELLDFFNIPKSILPEIKNSIDNFDVVDKSIFNKEIKITSLIGDQQGATIGQNCLNKNEGKITFGTGCFMMLDIGSSPIYSKNGLLTTPLFGFKNKITYALEGASFYAGAVVQWLRDELQIIANAEETEELAKNALDIRGLYLVPAFGGLGAPYWRGEAKAVIKGISNQTGKKEIVKAALDGVILQALDLVKTMEEDGVKFDKIRIDGGMVNNKWFNQRMSDILKSNIEIPENIESTSLGAAFLAGIGAEIFDFSDIANLHKIKETKSPKNIGNYSKFISGWKEAVKYC